MVRSSALVVLIRVLRRLPFGLSFELGDDLHVVEYPIDDDSDFAGEPIATARGLERTGGTVLGAWVRGDFLTALPEDVHIDENTTLLVAGTEAHLEAVEDAVGSSGHHYHPAPDPVIVAGGDTVSATVIGGLERAGLETLLVATDDGEFVDLDVEVVGDPTDEETLREAGIDDARTIVLALESDEDAILATLVARELDPEIDVLVAARQKASVSKLRAAGADYVLALPNVAGRMVVLSVFENEVMTLGDRLQLVRVETSTLTGDRLDPAALRERTGCAVVAVERDGDLDADLDEWTLERGDRLVLAGTERDINRFHEVFGDDEE